MKKALFVSSLILLFVLNLTSKLLAKEIPEHSFIKPYPGSILAENMSNYENFGEYEFTILDAVTNKKIKKNIQGKKWKLLWEVKLPDGSRNKDISRLEFFENYKSAAIERGGKVLFEDVGQLVFSVPRDDGGTTWCKLNTTANLGQQYLTIIDEKGFDRSMKFGPTEMKLALDKDGHIALYGILFDFDKATLKQESIEELSNVAILLKQNANLKVEIQGHTDNKGSDEYNLKLSQQRAESVKSFLTLFGIDPSRLHAKGYGETKPVASNDTEEGREQNRRVELVKL